MSATLKPIRCIRCKAPTDHHLVFDIDIPGIPVCSDPECERNVRLALITQDEKLRKQLLSKPKEKRK